MNDKKATRLFLRNIKLGNLKQSGFLRSKKSRCNPLESENWYRLLFDNSRDIILVHHICEGNTLGNFIEANRTACEMLGYTREELLNLSPEKISPGASNILDKLLEHNQAIGERELVTKDGKRISVELNVRLFEYMGKPTVLAVVRDITERKILDHALRKEREMINAILTSSPDSIIICDLKGTVLECNQAASDLYDYPSKQELIGISVLALIAKKDHERLLINTNKALENGVIRNIEYTGLKRDGKEFFLEVSSSVVYDDARKPLYFIAVAKDITVRKRLENDLLKAKEATDFANQAKSLFLASMSHEIRTPLNAVIAIGNLLSKTNMDQKQQEFLELMQLSGRNLLSIINNILDFSKIEAGKLEIEKRSFNLVKCIEESLAPLALTAYEKNINLFHFVKPDVHPFIIGDSARLSQVLVNLVSNAIKFTNKGMVTLCVEKIEEIGKIVELQFAVTDTGIGIPGDKQNLLFHAFTQLDSTTSRRHGGTGLGLAICQKLVSLMKGRIWAESREGKGSTFYFTIKALTTPVPQENAFLLGVNQQLVNKRILLISTDSMSLKIVESYCQRWGIDVKATLSVREALGLVKQDENFDLIIVDLNVQDRMDSNLWNQVSKLCEMKIVPAVLMVPLGMDGIMPEKERLFAAKLAKPLRQTLLYYTLLKFLDSSALEVKSIPEEDDLASEQLGKTLPVRIMVVEDDIVNQKIMLYILQTLGYKPDIFANGLEAMAAVERQEYDLIFMDIWMPEMDGLTAAANIRQRLTNRHKKPIIIAMTADVSPDTREIYASVNLDGYIYKPFVLEEIKAIIKHYTQQNRLEEDVKSDNLGEEKVEIIDERKLISIKQMGEKHGSKLLQEIIVLFLEQAELTFEEIKISIREEDSKRIRQKAHKLAGASLNLGFIEFGKICRLIQKEAEKSGSFNTIERLVENLEFSLKNLKVELQKHLS